MGTKCCFQYFLLQKKKQQNSKVNILVACISTHLCDYFCGTDSEKCIASSVRQILESVAD